MYIYVYIHRFPCVYICTHTCGECVYLFMDACMYICISIYVRMYGYMYIHVFICTCVRRLCVPLRAYEERIRICACKRVRIGCGWASRRFVAR